MGPFKIIPLVVFLLCTVVCRGQVVVQPTWYAKTNGPLWKADANYTYLAAMTPQRLSVFDIKTGDSIATYNAIHGELIGIRIDPNHDSVWILESHVVNKQFEHTVSFFDIRTATASVFTVLQDTLRNYENYNRNFDISPSGDYLLYNNHYYKGSPSSGKYDQSVLFVVSIKTGNVIKQDNAPFGLCMFSTIDDKIFFSGSYLYYYFTGKEGSQQTRSSSSTRLMEIRTDSLENVAYFSGRCTPSNDFSFVYTDESVFDYPDFQLLPNSNRKSLISPISFTEDGLSYFSCIGYSPLTIQLRNVADNTVIAELADSSGRKYSGGAFCWPSLGYTMRADSVGTVAVWKLDTNLKGRAGLQTLFPDTVVVLTFTQFPHPTFAPIGKKAELETETNADFFEHWWFESKEVEDCYVIVRLRTDDGIEVVDTSDIKFRPLLHDLNANSYWSVANQIGAHMSANGMYVGCATKDDVFRIDLVSNSEAHAPYKSPDFTRALACNNNGVVLIAQHKETGSDRGPKPDDPYTFSHMVTMSRITFPDTVADSKLFTYRSAGSGYPLTGTTQKLVVTKWVEGYGALIGWYCNVPYFGVPPTYYNLADGMEVDPLDLCTSLPLSVDYHAPSQTFAMSGLGTYTWYQGIEETPNVMIMKGSDGECIESQADTTFDVMSFSADGNYLITERGVYNRSLEPVQSSIRHTNVFTSIPQTKFGLTFNNDTLFSWSVPSGQQSKHIVLHAQIRSVQVDDAAQTLFVAFHNGTMETFKLREMSNLLFGHTFVTSVNESPVVSINAYPNPSTGTITITSPLLQVQGARITVFNALGSPLNQYSVSDSSGIQTIDLHDALGVTVPGAYYVRVEADGKVQSVAVAIVGQ